MKNGDLPSKSNKLLSTNGDEVRYNQPRLLLSMVLLKLQLLDSNLNYYPYSDTRVFKESVFFFFFPNLFYF